MNVFVQIIAAFLICWFIVAHLKSKYSSKQFDVYVEEIVSTQMVRSPPEFNANTKKQEVGGGEVLVKNSVSEYNEQIAKIPHPLPAYCFPIPKIMAVLCVRTLQYVGVYAEGIIRRGVDMELLEQHIRAANAGRLTQLAITDPHTYAVLLKTWLRRLAEPLVPYAVYKDALEFAKEAPDDDDNKNEDGSINPGSTYNNYNLFNYYNANDGSSVSEITTFVNTHLNPTHNLSLKYLIRFLRIFTIPPYVQSNLMNIENIARVMAPNLIHGDTKDGKLTPIKAIVHLPLEIQFTTLLLRELCVTGDEETLFESLDTSVRAELVVSAENGCSVLNYYTWG